MPVCNKSERTELAASVSSRVSFRRRSQAAQFLLVQTLPVFEVVVQVLHQIGQISKRYRHKTSSSHTLIIVLNANAMADEAGV